MPLLEDVNGRDAHENHHDAVGQGIRGYGKQIRTPFLRGDLTEKMQADFPSALKMNLPRPICQSEHKDGRKQRQSGNDEISPRVGKAGDEVIPQIGKKRPQNAGDDATGKNRGDASGPCCIRLSIISRSEAVILGEGLKHAYCCRPAAEKRKAMCCQSLEKSQPAYRSS